MAVDVLLGLQWGDEGKGKVVDLLAPKYNVVARFQGGPNAGHTLEFENINMFFIKFHQVYSEKESSISLATVSFWIQLFSNKK